MITPEQQRPRLEWPEQECSDETVQPMPQVEDADPEPVDRESELRNQVWTRQ
jgi:hypothetical protein